MLVDGFHKVVDLSKIKLLPNAWIKKYFVAASFS